MRAPNKGLAGKSLGKLIRARAFSISPSGHLADLIAQYILVGDKNVTARQLAVRGAAPRRHATMCVLIISKGDGEPATGGNNNCFINTSGLRAKIRCSVIVSAKLNKHLKEYIYMSVESQCVWNKSEEYIKVVYNDNVNFNQRLLYRKQKRRHNDIQYHNRPPFQLSYY